MAHQERVYRAWSFLGVPMTGRKPLEVGETYQQDSWLGDSANSLARVEVTPATEGKQKITVHQPDMAVRVRFGKDDEGNYRVVRATVKTGLGPVTARGFQIK